MSQNNYVQTGVVLYRDSQGDISGEEPIYEELQFDDICDEECIDNSPGMNPFDEFAAYIIGKINEEYGIKREVTV